MDFIDDDITNHTKSSRRRSSILLPPSMGAHAFAVSEDIKLYKRERLSSVSVTSHTEKENFENYNHSTRNDAEFIAVPDAVYASISAKSTAEDMKIESICQQHMIIEDLEASRFENSLLMQKIAELETAMLLSQRENDAMVNKCLTEIKNVESERDEYANQIVAAISQQMSELQDTAMSRIEYLESELMSERRLREVLESSAAAAGSSTMLLHSGVCDTCMRAMSRKQAEDVL